MSIYKILLWNKNGLNFVYLNAFWRQITTNQIKVSVILSTLK